MGSAPLSLEAALDNAWRLYGAHVEWIKHGDAKLGVLLASSVAYAAGFLAFVFTVSPDRVLAAVSISTAFVSVLASAYPLGPTLILPKLPPSFIYFGNAASKYPEAGPYLVDHPKRMGDGDALLKDLAGQTWSLGQIATVKFRCAGLATAAFTVAVVFGALAALVEAW